MIELYTYQERLGQYFRANDTKEELKASRLLTLIEPETYVLVRNYCFPKKPLEKSYEQLCDIIIEQFSQQQSVWRERIKFYEVKQESNVCFSGFYARVKSLARKLRIWRAFRRNAEGQVNV
ncbi:hypothetical protein NQ314_016796 [Rhamnusium bicolor]|uniref:Uncharacterized protein n=1 Tax=Rhamnusium bicolor TaxID=1586634 RepID=A0AAV8WXQ1_9CUCU|nr:hypothetical protein NQ314_016796 [Rhamnusium bicolor]